ncbi:MAG: aminotransferase [Polyangiaceae bacterium]|nr:aminotransferase [Polyangiaceae bacterium]
MALRPNPLLDAVVPPPIPEAQRWVEGRSFPSELPRLDLAQAVPSEPPPPAMTDFLAARLSDPATARYSAISGIPELRRALARDISARYSGNVSAEQVLISAGCNQAFCLATMSLASAGDEILLPVPYYFNHQMWLDMLGIRSTHLPFRADRGGVPDPADARSRIGPRTRAIVLVSPNNPTGAIYPPEILREFMALARSEGIALILDETYRDFTPRDAPPHGLFADADWEETLVHLYSFSKAFAITGYRVGAVVAAASFIAQVEKAMDTIAICAPRIGQEAALFGLGSLQEWRALSADKLNQRLSALRHALGSVSGYELVSAGAYFAYLKHPFRNRDGTAVAKWLATEQNMLCLPGSMFGPGQEAYLRLAFANVDVEAMPRVAERLTRSLRGIGLD